MEPFCILRIAVFSTHAGLHVDTVVPVTVDQICIHGSCWYELWAGRDAGVQPGLFSHFSSFAASDFLRTAVKSLFARVLSYSQPPCRRQISGTFRSLRSRHPKTQSQIYFSTKMSHKTILRSSEGLTGASEKSSRILSRIPPFNLRASTYPCTQIRGGEVWGQVLNT